MERIDSGYKLTDGTVLCYEIIMEDGKENGFDIFYGMNAKYPTYHQPEPYIPNPDISYEENAKQYCKQLYDSSISSEKPFMMTETMYTDLTSANEMMRADLDYLLLLNE